MKTGASVPGYSGGAERLSERVLSRGRRPDTKQCIRNRVLKDVAWGPSVETGASGPGYSGGPGYSAVVSDLDPLRTFTHDRDLWGYPA